MEARRPWSRLSIGFYTQEAVAYRIDTPNDAAASLRRIARKQAKAAIRDIRELDESSAVVNVLDCRKRCKKIRGIARLLRPSLGDDYRRTNDLFGEAARVLSGYRDTAALVETLDRAATSAGALPTELEPVREALLVKAEAETAALSPESGSLAVAEELLVAGRDVIQQWEMSADGWDVLSGGLVKTYRSGSRALARAEAKQTETRLHDLRTPAKYTWYHLRLLEQAAPSVLAPLAAAFHDLVDGLGDAHDLALLSSMLRDDPSAYGGSDSVDAACQFLDRYRLPLEAGSLGLAARLYAEDRRAFSARLGTYWNTWQSHGQEPVAGSIETVFESAVVLDRLTVVELRAIAAEINLPGRSSKRRDELLADLRKNGIGETGL